MRASLCLFALALVLVAWGRPGEAASSDDEIVIAVRVDTPPFASIDPDSGAFVGFFYDICTKAVIRAGYQFREEPVAAPERMTFLRSGDGDFDLLCDPTTITLKRMEDFSDSGAASMLEFSPIVYVANGSYAAPTLATAPRLAADLLNTSDFSTPQSCNTLIDRLFPAEDRSSSDETAQTPDANPKSWGAWLSGFIRFRLREPETKPPPEYVEIWGYLLGSTIGAEVGSATDPGRTRVQCTFDSHWEAAKQFCTGKLNRYFGDVDIVRAAIERYRTENWSDTGADVCPTDFSHMDKGTYEPYAFVLSSARVPEFPERFVCALYSMFEDKTIERLFDGTFAIGKSQALSTLFRINSIPAGTRDRPDDEATVCGVPSASQKRRRKRPREAASTVPGLVQIPAPTSPPASRRARPS